MSRVVVQLDRRDRNVCEEVVGARGVVAENGGQAEQHDACDDAAAHVHLVKRRAVSERVDDSIVVFTKCGRWS